MKENIIIQFDSLTLPDSHQKDFPEGPWHLLECTQDKLEFNYGLESPDVTDHWKMELKRVQ